MSPAETERRDQLLDDALTVLSGDGAGNKVELHLAVTASEEHAREHGLTAAQILILIDVACGKKFAEHVCMRVLKALIPQAHVPLEAVVKAISWVNCGINGPPVSRKMFIIRWILLVYDIIDDKDFISRFYNMVFPLLDYTVLCPFVCHLLYKMTREEDVALHRVQKINSLIKEMGQQPHLLGLLSVYKSFSPHLVSVPIPALKKAFFKKVDREWGERIKVVQHQHNQPQPSITEDLSLQNLTLHEAAQPRSKRRRLVPELEASTVNHPANAARRDEPRSLKPFGQITTLDLMLDNIDRIELPQQIASVLDNHLLQFYVCYTSDYAADRRLTFWLANTLTEEFLYQPASANLVEKAQLLHKLLIFGDKIKEGIPVLEKFIHRFLVKWNGDDFREFIMSLITRIHIHPFEELVELVFEPLRQLFFRSTVYFKCQVLYVYRELLKNWAVYEWPRHKNTKQNPNAAVHQHVFMEESTEVEPVQVMFEFVEYVSEMCVVALQLEQHHLDLISHTLAFFNTASLLYEDYGVPLMLFPSPSIFNCCLFSRDPSIFARTLTIVTRCARSVKALKTSSISKLLEQLGPAAQDACLKSISSSRINMINAHIMDSVNAMWKNDMFKDSQLRSNSLFHLEPVMVAKLKQYEPVENVLSLPFHPALAVYGYRMVVHMAEKHGDAVISEPLDFWVKNKEEFMDYLEKHHLPEVKLLFNQFIKSRASRINSTQAANITTSTHAEAH